MTKTAQELHGQKVQEKMENNCSQVIIQNHKLQIAKINK
jgi:hypothetical protein